MLKLDNNLLNELGLGGLPEEQKRAMLQHIYETLELRVGTNLANQMTDQQLEEFEKFIDEGGDANQAQALQWLETNLPNYKQVVNEVFEQLKVEIKQMAPQIMASNPAAPAAPIAQQPQQLPPTGPAQYQQSSQPQPIGPAPQPYQPPMDPIMQQPQPYQSPAQPQAPQPMPPAGPQPQAMPQQSPQPAASGFQPAPQGYQPAPQGFQPPQQSYPPMADTRQQNPGQQQAE